MIPPGATVVAASDHGKAYVLGKTLVVTVPGARLETTTLDLETMSELLALTEAACDYLATAEVTNGTK